MAITKTWTDDLKLVFSIVIGFKVMANLPFMYYFYQFKVGEFTLPEFLFIFLFIIGVGYLFYSAISRATYSTTDGLQGIQQAIIDFKSEAIQFFSQLCGMSQEEITIFLQKQVQTLTTKGLGIFSRVFQIIQAKIFSLKKINTISIKAMVSRPELPNPVQLRQTFLDLVPLLKLESGELGNDEEFGQIPIKQVSIEGLSPISTTSPVSSISLWLTSGISGILLILDLLGLN